MTYAVTTTVLAIVVGLIGLFTPCSTWWRRAGFLVLAAGIAIDSTMVGLLGLALVLAAAIHELMLTRRHTRDALQDQGTAIPRPGKQRPATYGDA